MLLIKVLGGGCRSCEITCKMIEDIARENHIPIYLEKVTDMQDILSYGVMSTPAVVVGEKVVHKGGIPDRSLILEWLKNPE